MNFGEALQALKEGKKVRREIWGGYWYLAKNISGDQFMATGYGPFGFGIKEMIIAVLKDDTGIAPAQPYQSDLLAEDWQILH